MIDNLFTSRGQLLISIMNRPGVTIKELATELFLTRRTVWGMIGGLRRKGYLVIRKEGRAHHYHISAYGLSELRKLTEGIKPDA